ncbi:hypothetical protein AB0C76_29200 [Kitasatospora sp. NPDC048722]|uniref:hypothetical protein n=1 Tax=Kitasatospora sp. NPDC048722 TaxID=3155639 RepID=UPI0033D237EF
MQRKCRKFGLRGAVVVPVAVAVALLGQGPAGASTAGWSVPSSGTPVEPGSWVDLGPQWYCRQGPCSYDHDSVFRLQAVNDAALGAGTIPHLVTGSSGATVGTCSLDSQALVCRPTGSGTLNSGDRLVLDSTVAGRASRSACTASFYVDWFDAAGVTPDPTQEETGQVEEWDTSGSCG